MSVRFLLILLCGLSSLSTACSQRVPDISDWMMNQKAQIKSTHDGLSTLFVYRPTTFANAMVSPWLLINQQKHIQLDNNQFTRLVLPPGQYHISLQLDKRYQGQHHIDLNIDQPSMYFLKISSATKFEMNRPYSRRFDITEIKKEIALKEIVHTIQVDDPRRNIGEKKASDTDASRQLNQHQFSIEKSRNPFGH